MALASASRRRHRRRRRRLGGGEGVPREWLQADARAHVIDDVRLNWCGCCALRRPKRWAGCPARWPGVCGRGISRNAGSRRGRGGRGCRRGCRRRRTRRRPSWRSPGWPSRARGAPAAAVSPAPSSPLAVLPAYIALEAATLVLPTRYATASWSASSSVPESASACWSSISTPERKDIAPLLLLPWPLLPAALRMPSWPCSWLCWWRARRSQPASPWGWRCAASSTSTGGLGAWCSRCSSDRHRSACAGERVYIAGLKAPRAPGALVLRASVGRAVERTGAGARSGRCKRRGHRLPRCGDLLSLLLAQDSLDAVDDLSGGRGLRPHDLGHWIVEVVPVNELRVLAQERGVVELVGGRQSVVAGLERAMLKVLNSKTVGLMRPRGRTACSSRR